MSAGFRPSSAWPLTGGGLASHFDQLCDTKHLFASWDKFARGKHTRADILCFERSLEKNIFNVRDQLKSRGYRHGRYEPFTVWDPKQRQIHKAGVRDRLIHQAIVSIIEPLFEPGFIYDSFSCRKGKGTHAGVKRLRKFLRQASRNDLRPVYALKCDIWKFFASVDHAILLNPLSIKIIDEQILALLKEIIDSFAVSLGKGIPLGNLTSQLFANVYMHELDFFVKHALRQKYYLRYCDDFVILSTDRKELADLVTPLNQFLASKLGLQLHPNKVSIRSWNQGIDFLGYVLKPYCVVLRNKTKNRMLKRANQTNISSYLGVCSHANSYELQKLLKTRAWNEDT